MRAFFLPRAGASFSYPGTVGSRRAFSMIELLTTIVIIAVIAVIATVFVGDYISRARLTAARHTVAVLNESLNEYRTLGGLTKGYSLSGSTGSTLNAATLTSTALEAMKTGFTNFGRRQTFVKQQDALNTTYLGSTGSGKSFHFVVDETSAAAGTTMTKATPKLSVVAASVTYGAASARVDVAAEAEGAALVGKTVMLSFNGSTSTDTMRADGIATFTIDTSSLAVGSYDVSASVAGFTSGTTTYAAASASGILTVYQYGEGVGYMAKASAGTYRICATTSTGYMAFKDASGTVSIQSVSSVTTTSLASSISYTFWPCAGASSSAQSGSLTFLDCNSNALTSLDVSANTKLRQLYCPSNALTSLNVSKNTVLTQLYCNSNALTSLDVSGCTALKTLLCNSNALTSLDVSRNTALVTLYCDSNALTSLNVSKNTVLTRLYCDSNALTSLDVSGCTALALLRCDSNALTSLDVSGCTALTNLYVDADATLTGVPSGCTVTTY